MAAPETNLIREYKAGGRLAGDGPTFQAEVLRFTRHSVAAEIYDPGLALRSSQALDDFSVTLDSFPVYSGRAVVGSVIHTGSTLVCEVKLSPEHFKIARTSAEEGLGVTSTDFGAFLRLWQKTYRVLPEFKVAVADMQAFLHDLRRWMNQLEMDLGGMGKTGANGHGIELIYEAGREVVAAYNTLHERFEKVADGIDPDSRSAHEDFAKRQLHPLILCSPFAHRTYTKPLGYAGDYEMVNMMLRDPFEGGSLYARALNNWFVSQWPAEAHRNRITYLTDRLMEEALRGARRRRPVRVLNLGCGPAHEIVRFLGQSDLCEHTEFTLWDFNDETVQQTGCQLEDCKRRHHRSTRIRVVKKSVHQVLKEGSRGVTANSPQFDYIYCAGLFDYLTDRTCRQILDIFYSWLLPGGRLVATNVETSNPLRNGMEHLLDWHLIYRTAAELRELAPAAAPDGDCRVVADATGVNVMLEVSKPDHA